MALGKQGLVILQRPEAGVNRVVVIHIVLVVGVRGVHWGQPQLVKAHVADVVQLSANPVQVPDAIAVRVAERIDKDLVRCAIGVVNHRRHKALVVVDHLDRRGRQHHTPLPLVRNVSQKEQQRTQEGRYPLFETFHHETYPRFETLK